MTMAVATPEDFEARLQTVMELPLDQRHDALQALYDELGAVLDSPDSP